jgi:hypothetical protein
LQLPGESSQRPGWPAAAGAPHSPEQQSAPVQQVSPKEAQLETGRHLPPWQFVEQQSVPSVHASPETLHVFPEAPAGSTSQRPSVPQTPVQQSLPVLHD